MKLSQTLKQLWETLTYGPSEPVKEVREALEAKGYRYETQLAGVGVGMPGGAVALNSVFNKAGEKVAYNRPDHAPSAEYRRDYDAAYAAYKAAKYGAPGKA